MKLKNIFFSTLLLSTLTYTSCTEDSAKVDSSQYTIASTLTTDEVTTSLKTDIYTEDIAILANDQFEAKIGASTLSTVPAAPYTSILPANATTTVADALSGTPAAPITTRTITITFGTAAAVCIFRGHTLKGQIILAHPYTTNATKDMTVAFNNFSIDGNTIEATGTSISTWQRVMLAATTTAPILPARPKNTLTLKDVKFTTSNGVYIRSGWNAREMTSGYATRLDLTDDINSVNQSYVTKDPSGYLVNSFTISSYNYSFPLVYNTSCSLGANALPFAGAGSLFITKGSHSAVIKYGVGGCDNLARIAIDIKLEDYFTTTTANLGNPVQYNSSLYAIVPVTTPPTTPPSDAERLAIFDAKFDSMAVPYTLQ